MLATEIQKYTDDYSNVHDPVLHEVERSTHLHTIAPQMLSGRVQGAFLTLMTSLLQARNVLEIGTFTGYGTICLVRGLSPSAESKVVTIEANPEYAFLIKKHLAMAGVTDRVESLMGKAQALLSQRTETWDLVFIDANKQEYAEYYEAIIDHVRPGGLILSDNVLWSGKVVYDRSDVDARVIHKYNEMLYRDPRVEVLMLPIRDGLSVARRV
ncbi:MAG: O-methyltransferase [Saprospiraceae bacterium]|nr:O-methyltransferase [Candidatus Opimibacter iunctus]